MATTSVLKALLGDAVGEAAQSATSKAAKSTLGGLLEAGNLAPKTIKEFISDGVGGLDESAAIALAEEALAPLNKISKKGNPYFDWPGWLHSDKGSSGISELSKAISEFGEREGVKIDLDVGKGGTPDIVRSKIKAAELPYTPSKWDIKLNELQSARTPQELADQIEALYRQAYPSANITRRGSRISNSQYINTDLSDKDFRTMRISDHPSTGSYAYGTTPDYEVLFGGDPSNPMLTFRDMIEDMLDDDAVYDLVMGKGR